MGSLYIRMAIPHYIRGQAEDRCREKCTMRSATVAGATSFPEHLKPKTAIGKRAIISKGHENIFVVYIEAKPKVCMSTTSAKTRRSLRVRIGGACECNSVQRIRGIREFVTNVASTLLEW